LVLFGISPRSELLKAVSPQMVVLLLENVRPWFEKRFAGAKANAFYDFVGATFVSNPVAGNLMNVEAFLKFFVESVRRLLAEEESGRRPC
jgi:hypothetical protein